MLSKEAPGGDVLGAEVMYQCSADVIDGESSGPAGVSDLAGATINRLRDKSSVRFTKTTTLDASPIEDHRKLRIVVLATVLVEYRKSANIARHNHNRIIGKAPTIDRFSLIQGAYELSERREELRASFGLNPIICEVRIPSYPRGRPVDEDPGRKLVLHDEQNVAKAIRPLCAERRLKARGVRHPAAGESLK